MKRSLRKIFACMMSAICMMTFLTIWDGTEQKNNKVLADEEELWKLVWEDEFNGDSLDLTKWNNEGATGRNGWGNNELQDYQLEYSEVKDGKFIIKPQFQWNAATKKLVDNSVYSTRVWTKGLNSVKYGKIEFRAKMPTGEGTCAKAWMLGNEYDWPQCGEIDVASTVNSNKNIINQSIHCPKFNLMPTSSGNKGINAEILDATTAYHTYGIIWTENNITFTIDGKNTLIYDPSFYSAAATEDINVWPFNQPFYMIFDCAVGGTLGGEVTPNGWTEISRDGDIVTYEDYYTIDWIRIYEANDSGKNETENIIELSANAYRTESNIQIDINYKASGEVDGYQIKISNDQYFSDDADYIKTITSKNEKTTFILDRALDTECVYIKVRAYTLTEGSKKNGDWSEALTVYLSEGDENDNVEWHIDENVLYWDSGVVNEYGYSIEDEIPWYDRRDEIKKIVIGAGVNFITNYTFMDCSNLESVQISSGVNYIGEAAFWGCDRLNNIYVDENNLDYLSIDGVLFDKEQTVIVKYPNAREGKYVIPDTVTTIGGWAFRECYHLTELTIPNSVTEFKPYSFYDCTSLLDVTVPDSVVKMNQCGLGLKFYKGSGDELIEGFVLRAEAGSVAEAYYKSILELKTEDKNLIEETTTVEAVTTTTNDNQNITTAENLIGNKKVSVPKKTGISKVKAGKKKVSLTIRKIKGAKGYLIQYSAKRNFKGAKKKYTKKTKFTIKKLKSKKTYYFRVKAYKLDGKKKVLSKKWSSVKKVKIK